MDLLNHIFWEQGKVAGLAIQDGQLVMNRVQRSTAMAGTEDNKSAIAQVGEDLFSYAIDREDIKTLVAHLPKETSCKPATVEYELQLLKIISTGWSLAFFLENNPLKGLLTEAYWKSIHEFAGSLSEATGFMTGHAIDYFQIVKERLDTYITTLKAKPGAPEPAAVIGPEFARHCGNAEDVFAVLTGSRMFIMTVGRVKEYLDATGIHAAH